jgi:hypothetical protein
MILLWTQFSEPVNGKVINWFRGETKVEAVRRARKVAKENGVRLIAFSVEKEEDTLWACSII